MFRLSFCIYIKENRPENSKFRAAFLLYPTPYPLEIPGLLERLFHAVLCVLAHGLAVCCISVHREGAGVVTKLLLHGLHGASGLKGDDRAAVAAEIQTFGFSEISKLK